MQHCIRPHGEESAASICVPEGAGQWLLEEYFSVTLNFIHYEFVIQISSLLAQTLSEGTVRSCLHYVSS